MPGVGGLGRVAQVSPTVKEERLMTAFTREERTLKRSGEITAVTAATYFLSRTMSTNSKLCIRHVSSSWICKSNHMCSSNTVVSTRITLM